MVSSWNSLERLPLASFFIIELGETVSSAWMIGFPLSLDFFYDQLELVFVLWQVVCSGYHPRLQEVVHHS